MSFYFRVQSYLEMIYIAVYSKTFLNVRMVHEVQTYKL